MKTLNQVEPRQPIHAAPYEISQPGSYYLTTNLSDKVIITADNVTLDLMGFTVSASGSRAIGFDSASKNNITVRNGIVTAPSGTGLDFSDALTGSQGLLEDLRVIACSADGIFIGSGFLVRNCRVTGAGGAGLRILGESEARNNTLVQNGVGLRVTGSGAILSDNHVRLNADNYQIAAGNHASLLLSQIPEVLDFPCAAKLVGTLTCTGTGTNGIDILADHVTIDLAGHSLVGPGAASGNGIFQSSQFGNLRVFNGKVANWRGIGSAGIMALGNSPSIAAVQATSNHWGLLAERGGILKNCQADQNKVGITLNNGGLAMECTTTSNTVDGFYIEWGSTVRDCSAWYNYGEGFTVRNACFIESCTAQRNTGNGFDLQSRNRIRDCASMDNGFLVGAGDGIMVWGERNHVEGNHCVGNDVGINVEGTRNFITRNTCSGNTMGNWFVQASNVCLVVNSTQNVMFGGDSGGTSPGSADPNANFTH